jgi:hypothetical protein
MYVTTGYSQASAREVLSPPAVEIWAFARFWTFAKNSAVFSFPRYKSLRGCRFSLNEVRGRGGEAAIRRVNQGTSECRPRVAWQCARASCSGAWSGNFCSIRRNGGLSELRQALVPVGPKTVRQSGSYGKPTPMVNSGRNAKPCTGCARNSRSKPACASRYGHLGIEPADTQSVAPRIAGYAWCQDAFTMQGT